MNLELKLILIPLFMALLAALVKTYAIPFFTQTILPFIHSKTSPGQRELIYKYVVLGVEFAERQFDERGQGATKREFVINYINKIFKWKIDEKTLDAFIEAAVEELNKYIDEVERNREKIEE